MGKKKCHSRAREEEEVVVEEEETGLAPGKALADAELACCCFCCFNLEGQKKERESQGEREKGRVSVCV